MSYLLGSYSRWFDSNPLTKFIKALAKVSSRAFNLKELVSITSSASINEKRCIMSLPPVFQDQEDQKAHNQPCKFELVEPEEAAPVEDIDPSKIKKVFEFPTGLFKISNGDNPIVRQMLADAGYEWCTGKSLTSHRLEGKFLFMGPQAKSATMCDSVGYFESKMSNHVDFTSELKAELG